MLVLSLFPGIDLLGRAFEEVWPEACIVRGPDVLWGGDIRRFHPPTGRFDGVIGGPPCQHWSQLQHMVIKRYGAGKLAENLIPEFERCVGEVRPGWFLMENVPAAPLPVVEGYAVTDIVLNNRWIGGEQERKRRFSFGILGDRRIDLSAYLDIELFEPLAWAPAVLASGGGGNGYAIRCDRGGRPKRGRNNLHEMRGRGSRQTVAEGLRLQGLPADFFEHSPLTVEGQQKMIGNGVPLPLGRAVAKAVKAALEDRHD